MFTDRDHNSRTPCAQRTQASNPHLAYPSPVSAPRPNPAASTSNLGRQVVESPSRSVQAEPTPPEPSDLLNRAKDAVLAYLWPKLGPFLSRPEDESVPEDSQAGLDAVRANNFFDRMLMGLTGRSWFELLSFQVVEEQRFLRARITERDQEKANLQQQINDFQIQACGHCSEKDTEVRNSFGVNHWRYLTRLPGHRRSPCCKSGKATL